MQKIFIIGTSHGIIPKHREEFSRILEEINPDQILVEIDSRHLDNKKKFEKYPKEFIYAYKWALRNNKKAGAFDFHINILKKTIIKKQHDALNKELAELTEKYGWKRFNSPKYLKLIEGKIKKVLDPIKHKRREKRMLENIKNMIIPAGKVLILTGSYHLKFFEKYLKGAIFPLRE